MARYRCDPMALVAQGQFDIMRYNKAGTITQTVITANTA